MKNQSEAKPKEQSKIDNPETPENITVFLTNSALKLTIK